MMQKQGLPTVFRKGNDRVSENDREEKKEKRQRQHCDTEAVFGSFSEQKKLKKGPDLTNYGFLQYTIMIMHAEYISYLLHYKHMNRPDSMIHPSRNNSKHPMPSCSKDRV
jgi:hypothetical protein